MFLDLYWLHFDLLITHSERSLAPLSSRPLPLRGVGTSTGALFDTPSSGIAETCMMYSAFFPPPV